MSLDKEKDDEPGRGEICYAENRNKISKATKG